MSEQILPPPTAAMQDNCDTKSVVTSPDLEECWEHFPDYPIYKAGTARIHWPPGFLGHMAKYMYCTNASPCPEYAIAAAIGLFAGICGRGWIYSGTGLNHDIVIVGGSGTGKNVVHQATANIVNQLGPSPISSFITSGQVASGPALIKAVITNPCQVQIWGEVGKLYRAFARCRAGDAYDTLRTVKLDLWERSGPDSGAVGIAYSNQNNSVTSQLGGVAHSMIGESTGHIFYKAITDEMMADGTMSRLWIIEYVGEDPELNEHKLTKMPETYSNYLRELVLKSATAMKPVEVGHTEGARESLEACSDMCRQFRREAQGDESKRQQWTRAYEKVFRLAALLAVADNYMHPTITTAQVDWAIMLLMRANSQLETRLSSGDIGSGDHNREITIFNRVDRWLRKPSKDPQREAMRKVGIITRKFLQQETSRLESFMEHKLGATAALDMALRSLVDSGYFMEVDKKSLNQNYNFHGKAYLVLNSPDASPGA